MRRKRLAGTYVSVGVGFWVCPIFKVKRESKIARLVYEDKFIKLLKPAGGLFSIFYFLLLG